MISLSTTMPGREVFGQPQLSGVTDALSFFFWGALFLTTGAAIGYAIGVERSIRGGLLKSRR